MIQRAYQLVFVINVSDENQFPSAHVLAEAIAESLPDEWWHQGDDLDYGLERIDWDEAKGEVLDQIPVDGLDQMGDTP